MIRTLDELNRDQIVKFKIISSDPLIKLKKYDQNVTGLGPSIDRNGLPVTGLAEDFEIKDDKNRKVQVKGTRRALEEELGLAEGTLKVRSPYWIRFSVKVGADDLVWDLNDPMDCLKYLFVCAQSNVAKGLKEIDTNPYAEFVVWSEQEEHKEKNKSRRNYKDAVILADKLDMETKMNVLAVYGLIADASEPASIEAKLDDYIEEDPGKFLAICRDDFLLYKSLITKCQNAGILQVKEGGAVYHEEIPLGLDLTEAAKNLAKNKKLEAVLKAKLSGDMELLAQVVAGQKDE